MNTAKKILLILTPMWLFLAAQTSYAQHAEIIIEAENGNVIHEVNAGSAWFPASLTKLMTFYVTFEALKANQIHLHDTLQTSSYAASQPTSKLGLRTGESITVRDAILALITRSANDAAVVLAEGLSGTEENFAVKMTATAHALGMYKSHFMNATGLPNQWQVTTARDLGLLAWKTQRNFPEYYPYFSVPNLIFRGHELKAINKFTATYPGAEGMKTGFTCGSGYNLISSATQNGRRLIGVVLGGTTSPERYQLMISMMNNTFANNFISTGLNITAMTNNEAGTPPYQLGCGHFASSTPSTIPPVFIPRHHPKHKLKHTATPVLHSVHHNAKAANIKHVVHTKSVKAPVSKSIKPAPHSAVQKIKPAIKAKVSKIHNKAVAKPLTNKKTHHHS